MPRIRFGEEGVRDVNLRGSVWDHADLLAGVTRAALRSFVTGPWGRGEPALAAEMIRRTHTPPCDQQCFITAHADGSVAKKGCHCDGSGWQYADDSDVQALERCGPNDVWNDARAILHHHEKVGRGPDDPILCDCDDLTIICAAVAKYEGWVRAGAPARKGVPLDSDDVRVYVAITKPFDSTMAHAYMLSNLPPTPGEPIIKVGDLYVFDPAARWGMRRPPDKFYGSGHVAKFLIRFSDLAGD